jgi:sugar phosphate isomerase/epimerase
MRVGYSLIVAPALIALALSCATAAPARAGNRNDADAEKLGFKLSLQCYTFRQLTFFETVDKAAELGIKYLEIYPGQKLKPGSKLTTVSNMSDEVLQEIQKKLADAGGLKVVAYGVAGVPTDEPGLRKTFDWAKKIGIEVLVTETTPIELHDKFCTEYNIRMALHNHPKTWPPEKVLAACKDHCKLIGSCSDTGHWMRANRVPVDMLKMLQGRVEHLHFKDLDQFGMKGQDVPWGTGKGNPKAMMQELQRQGFHGYFSIEYEHGTVPELMVNLARCVEFFDKTAGELAR